MYVRRAFVFRVHRPIPRRRHDVAYAFALGQVHEVYFRQTGERERFDNIRFGISRVTAPTSVNQTRSVYPSTCARCAKAARILRARHEH